MLKLVSIFLLALTIFQKANSQSSPDTVYLKGLNFVGTNKTDSALNIFYNMYNKHGNKYFSRALIQIADIELKNGNLIIADSFYKMCLKDTSKNSLLEKYSSALSLANICIRNQHFGEGLNYLEESQKFKPGNYCSLGSFNRQLSFRFKYSICLNGLGFIDSAINQLTPFMFQGQESISYNEKLYTEVNSFYYSLLKKKYDQCALKEFVNESLNNLQFSKSIDTTSVFAKNGNKCYSIECKLFFLKTNIWLLSTTICGSKTKEPINPYNKDYFLKNVIKSPLYKLIMN